LFHPRLELHQRLVFASRLIDGCQEKVQNINRRGVGRHDRKEFLNSYANLQHKSIPRCSLGITREIDQNAHELPPTVRSVNLLSSKSSKKRVKACRQVCWILCGGVYIAWLRQLLKDVCPITSVVAIDV
jgi:hypothetical protein